MAASTVQVLPVIEIFKIVGRVDDFEKWFLQTYSQEPDSDLLHGYKYFLEGCFHMLFDQLGSKTFAGLNNDLLLDRAISQWVSLEKLNNTCEKIVFLKNVYSHWKTIKKSKTFANLQSNVKKLNQDVIQPVNSMLEKSLSFKDISGLSKENWVRVAVIVTLYLYFGQIANNSPVAHVSFLGGVISRDKKKKAIVFEGYKYALQFVWYKVLGAKKFSKTSLSHLHKADSWKNYKYSNDLNQELSNFNLINHDYDIGNQTCLDSYCEDVKQEIILPIEKKYKINIIGLDKDWKFSPTAGRRSLRDLLNAGKLTNPFIKLSVEDKIQTILYWYPLEVVDYASNSSFNGISAFNTMLAGTAALLNRKSEFKKCIVCKFKHPINQGGSSYSYGILIDSKSAADHYMSGWVIYYDCCNDYSGFSSSEFRTAENLIKKLQKANKLELRELEIDYDAFSGFIASYIHKEKKPNEKDIDEFNRLKEISLRNQQLWPDAKAMILEWLAYHAHSSNFPRSNIKWNIEKNKAEIDVFMEMPEYLKLIECKINPNNCDLKMECKKLIDKAIQKSKTKAKPYSAEFWFWLSPSEQNIKILAEHDIKYCVVTDRQNSKLLKNMDLSRIKTIMQIEFE